MIQNPLHQVRMAIAVAACFLIVAGTFAGFAQTGRRQRGTPVNDPDDLFPTDPVTNLPRRMKQDLLKHNLEKMRKDAAEMAQLASSIQEDLEKTTENELPLKVVAQAEKVEKLAKRIKNTAKGF